MNDVNINSENQSGGITAQNVNSDNIEQTNTNQSTPTEKGNLRKVFWWIFGIAGLVAALIAIYQFLL